jgi:hypothetical protein
MYNPQAYGAAPQQPMYNGSAASVMGGSEAMDAGMAHLHQAGGKYGLSRLPLLLLLLLLSLSLLLFQARTRRICLPVQ